MSPSRSSCRHSNQEPHAKHFYPRLSHKKEFLKTPQWSLLVLPSPGEVPTPCQDPEETSGPGEKPPTKTHPSHLELLILDFSVGCRTVCWRESKENDFQKEAEERYGLFMSHDRHTKQQDQVSVLAAGCSPTLQDKFPADKTQLDPQTIVSQ